KRSALAAYGRAILQMRLGCLDGRGADLPQTTLRELAEVDELYDETMLAFIRLRLSLPAPELLPDDEWFLETATRLEKRLDEIATLHDGATLALGRLRAAIEKDRHDEALKAVLAEHSRLREKLDETQKFIESIRDYLDLVAELETLTRAAARQQA